MIDYYEEDAKLIQQINELRQNDLDNIIKEFLHKINFHDAVFIEETYHKVTIYTTRPGVWIGKAGCNVDLLKKMLRNSEWFAEDVDVAFKEIHGQLFSNL